MAGGAGAPDSAMAAIEAARFQLNAVLGLDVGPQLQELLVTARCQGKNGPWAPPTNAPWNVWAPKGKGPPDYA